VDGVRFQQKGQYEKVYRLTSGSRWAAGSCNQSVQNASNKFNELPPAMQKTARAQDPNSEIVDVSMRRRVGRRAWTFVPAGKMARVSASRAAQLAGPSNSMRMKKRREDSSTHS
jgi:hypothetical protein